MTPTMFTSLRKLESQFRFVDPTVLIDTAHGEGLNLNARHSQALPAGKSFDVLRFTKDAGLTTNRAGAPIGSCHHVAGARGSFVAVEQTSRKMTRILASTVTVLLVGQAHSQAPLVITAGRSAYYDLSSRTQFRDNRARQHVEDTCLRIKPYDREFVLPDTGQQRPARKSMPAILITGNSWLEAPSIFRSS